ncbi:MAG: NAD-dependent deacylase [Verrucomicrobia bacterium]|nr:NAD-dependent deacylase [Verrucomicrobiota bacterium]
MAIEIPRELVESLRRARRVAVLTGAGVSAESGVPTFRDAQTGLWARFRPEELATPRAFRLDPRRVWEWYAWRRELVARAEPNAAHRALVAMEARQPEFTLITQNVDGLHTRAGSRNVIELHGNLHRTKCFDEDVAVSEWTDTGDVPPRCPRCGGLLRPDVVWFEENLPVEALARAMECSAACDVFLSVGTATVVYPAAELPLRARAGGARLVEINPSPTPISAQAHHVLRGPAGEVLPELLRAWTEHDPVLSPREDPPDARGDVT